MAIDEEGVALSLLLDKFLNDLIGQDRLRPLDLFMFVMNILTRLRAYFTIPDMMQTLYGGVMRNEMALQRGAAIQDPETGESMNMILAEERMHLGDEKVEVPDTVPEGWEDSIPPDTIPEDWTDDG